YATDRQGGVYRSADGGRSWELASDRLPGHGDPGFAGPYSPVVLVPGAHATLYVGLAHLWKTDGAMQSWTNLTATLGSRPVRAMAVAPSDPQTIYFADVGQHLFGSRDGGMTWHSLDGKTCSPASYSPYWCASDD